MPSADDAPLTLGAALRQAREAAGQSVEQVSASTRIRATLVRDLEADRFASSGGAVYARGHVRALAAAVGADYGALLPLFEAQQSGEAAAPAAAPVVGPVAPLSFGSSPLSSGPLGRPLSDGPERRTPRWGVAAAVAVALLLVVLVVGTLRSPSKGSAQSGPSPRATATASRPAPSATPVQPSAAPVAPVVPVSGAQLQVSIIGGVSWVSIRNATGTLFEGVLPAGTAKSFSDPSALDVKVGNAGAVALRCGGRSSGRAGASGKVLQFSCTQTGLVPA